MKSLSGDPQWAAAFTAAGLPTAHEPNMALWLRCHVPLAIAFEGASVLAVKRGARRGVVGRGDADGAGDARVLHAHQAPRQGLPER